MLTKQFAGIFSAFILTITLGGRNHYSSNFKHAKAKEHRSLKDLSKVTDLISSRAGFEVRARPIPKA